MFLFFHHQSATAEAPEALAHEPLTFGRAAGKATEWMRPQLDIRQDVLAPEAQFRQVVKELTPNMDERQVDAVGLLASGLAYAQDMSLEDWLGKTFAPQIAERAELPAGKKGAVRLFEDGRSLIQITERSDFSTWTHEIFHAVFHNLPEERTSPMAQWAGALKEDGTIDWNRQLSDKPGDIAQEKLTAAWVKYLQEGIAPTEELRTLFQRMAEWLVKAWEIISGQWVINDDIRQWMATLLTKPESGVGRAAAPTQGTTTEVKPQAHPARAETVSTEEFELFQAIIEETANGSGKVLYQTDPQDKPELAEDINKVRTLVHSTAERIKRIQADDYQNDGMARFYAKTDQLPVLVDHLTRLLTALQRVTDKGIAFTKPERPYETNILSRGIRPEEKGQWRVSYIAGTTTAPRPTGHHVGGLIDLVEDQITNGWSVAEARGQPLMGEPQRVTIRPDILFQPEAGEEHPTWYLRSQRTIQQKMMGPMPGRQVLKMLQNAGIKEDELKWTGLATYLDTDERRSPQEVQDRIALEVPQLSEVTKGEDRRALGEQPVFKQWTLPGGENYRELLLTMPGEMDQREKIALRMFGAPFDALDTDKALAVDAEAKNAGDTTYRGPHWPETNVLVHARFDERLDSEGRRVLLVEEIQSDWHQQGREKGYRSEQKINPDTLSPRLINDADEHHTAEWAIVDAAGNEVLPHEFAPNAHRAMEQIRLRFGQGVPDAPFRKTWHELMFRRMLRWAAENDFDVLAWTTGEQQAERYDLSKQLDLVNVFKSPTDDGYIVRGEKGGAQVYGSSAVPRDQLANYVGKEMAVSALERLDAMEKQAGGEEYRGVTFSGLDLKIGGEGMKGFYDQILPAYAKKYGKQWGAKVGEAEVAGPYENVYERAAGGEVYVATNAIAQEGQGQFEVTRESGEVEEIFDTREAAQAYAEELNRSIQEGRRAIQYLPVHSLDITPSMRESVLQGQVLFQPDMSDVPGEPKLAGVLDGIVKGMPVENRVLEVYREHPQVAAEISRRKLLVDQARKASSVDEFVDWMARAESAAPATDAYYKMVYGAAQKSTEDPDVAGDRFVAALDDRSIVDMMAGIQFIEGDNPESETIRALTPEMRELGKAGLKAAAPPELIQKVREQVAANPELWRKVLKDNLPDSLRDIADAVSNKETDADAPTDFRPVTARSANLRFMKMMTAEGGVEAFLGDLYHEENMGARAKGKRGGQGLPVAMKVAASKAQRGIPFDAPTRKGVLREIRNDATGWRQQYAGLYADEEMIMQLQWETEHADEDQVIAVIKENSRLRDQVKKLRAAGQIETADLSGRRLEELQKMVQEKDAALIDAAVKVGQSREALAAVEEQLSKEQRKSVEVEIGVEPPADAPAIIKAYYRRMQRLEEQIAFQRQAMMEAALARTNAERAQKLTHYIFKPVDTGIAVHEGRMIDDIQNRLTYSPEDIPPALLSRVKEWRRRNPTAELPSDLVQQIEKRQPREMTLAELEEIAIQVRDFRRQGREKRQEKLALERIFVTQQVESLLGALAGKGPEAGEPPIGGTRESHKGRATGTLMKVYLGTLRSNRFSDMLDGGHKFSSLKPAELTALATQTGLDEYTLKQLGPASLWLYSLVNEASDAQLTQMHNIQEAHKAKLKELGVTAKILGRVEQFPGHRLTHGEMLGVYIYAEATASKDALTVKRVADRLKRYQEKGLFALVTDDRVSPEMIERILGILSPEEKKYADWMVDTLSSDEVYDRTLEVQVEFNNQWMERQGRYFPIQREGQGGGPLIPEMIAELIEMRGYRRRQRVPGFLRSRMERKEGVKFPEMKLDAPAIFSSHVAKREYFIANAVLMKRLGRIFNDREVQEAMTVKFGDAMPKLVGKYISALMADNIYRLHEDWADLSRLMRTNVSMGMIGWNFMTIARNLVDIPMMMVMAGPIDAVGAAAQMIRNPRETFKFFHDNAPQFADRSYDRFTEEMKQLNRNLYEKIMRKVGEAGFVSLYMSDLVTNAIGWTAVYNRTMRRTGNHLAAQRAGRDFLLSHRPAARAKDLAQFYRDPGIAPWFLLFSNQTNQQFNIVGYDIPKAIGAAFRGDFSLLPDAALQMSALIVGAIGMAMVERKRMPEKDEWLRDVPAFFAGQTPFIGRLIEDRIRGDRMYSTLSPFSGVAEATGVAMTLLEGEDEEKIKKAVDSAIFGLMTATGAPGTQARRFFRFAQSGNAWDMVGGPPKKAAGE